MIKTCEYPSCNHTAQFLMCWNNKNGKHSGMVCASHDRKLGRKNLMRVGMTLDETILFEKYCKLTVDDANPTDWPEWLETHTDKISTMLSTRTLQPSELFQTHSTRLLSLSPRVWNVLRRDHIITIEQLIDTSDRELLRIRLLGPKGLTEIHERLQEYKDG